MFLSLLRSMAVTACGVWLGGMIVLAIAAQATFSVLRATDVERPSALAGQVVAPSFLRFEYVQMICAAAMVLWQLAALVAGPRRRRDWLRLALIATCGLLLLYSSQVLTPMITDLQPLLRSEDPESAVRQTFNQFHAPAVLIFQIMMVLLAMLCLEMSWEASARRADRSRPADAEAA